MWCTYSMTTHKMTGRLTDAECKAWCTWIDCRKHRRVMARLRRKKAELRIEVGRKHTLIRGLSHIVSLLIHLGNCRHPGGCFGLLALISAVCSQVIHLRTRLLNPIPFATPTGPSHRQTTGLPTNTTHAHTSTFFLEIRTVHTYLCLLRHQAHV